MIEYRQKTKNYKPLFGNKVKSLILNQLSLNNIKSKF